METEKEYADELVEQYMYRCYECDTFNIAINNAINDVTNTIKALKKVWQVDKNILEYYQTVLQILKERL